MASNTKETRDVLLEVSDSVHLCRVCYEEFNDRSKLSRILSCGHSFCTECLLSVVRASNSSYPTCPECRKLTKQTVLSLPVNFHFMQMVRKLGLTVDSPDDEVSSTAATIGREDPTHGELDINRHEDLTMPELITQFRSILNCMKDKTSRGMYQQYSFGEPNYPLSLCMDKLSEIDDALDIIENSLALAADDEDDTSNFDEDDEEDMYDTVYVLCNLRVDYIITYHYDPNYQYYYNTPPPPPQTVITYPSLPTYLLQDGTSSEQYRHLVGPFGSLSVSAPIDPFANMAEDAINQQFEPFSEQISWFDSGETNSRYNGEIFIQDVNVHGHPVLRCSICECQVPIGSENSHINGRRHSVNVSRTDNNLPIIPGAQWQQLYRTRSRLPRNSTNSAVPVPPSMIPSSWFRVNDDQSSTEVFTGWGPQNTDRWGN